MISSPLKMSAMDRQNIILFGIPRCGSTWLSEVLTSKTGIRRVHEPDNEINSYFGLCHKIGLHRYPFLLENDQQSAFLQLFSLAFKRTVAEQTDWQNKFALKASGISREQLFQKTKETGIARNNSILLNQIWLKLTTGKASSQRTLVKTVHAILAVPFLVDKLNCTAIVLNRHPLNIYSSYVNLDMPDGNRELFKNNRLLEYYEINPITDANNQTKDYLAGYQLGVFNKVIDSYKNIPNLVHVQYEEIISNPFEEVQQLFEKLNIEHTTEVEEFMKSKFTKGKGFDTNRDIKGHESIWKKRLTAKQSEEFLKGYEFAFGSINFEV